MRMPVYVVRRAALRSGVAGFLLMATPPLNLTSRVQAVVVAYECWLVRPGHAPPV
jgi:hypothetical protein